MRTTIVLFVGVLLLAIVLPSCASTGYDKKVVIGRGADGGDVYLGENERYRHRKSRMPGTKFENDEGALSAGVGENGEWTLTVGDRTTGFDNTAGVEGMMSAIRALQALGAMGITGSPGAAQVAPAGKYSDTVLDANFVEIVGVIREVRADLAALRASLGVYGGPRPQTE